MEDLLNELMQDLWHISHNTSIDSDTGSYGRAWKRLVKIFDHGYVDNYPKYLKFKQLYNRIESHAIVYNAYLRAQDGDMGEAHRLYRSMEDDPVWFWGVVEKCGKEADKFFWNLYHPDNPI